MEYIKLKIKAFMLKIYKVAKKKNYKIYFLSFHYNKFFYKLACSNFVKYLNFAFIKILNNFIKAKNIFKLIKNIFKKLLKIFLLNIKHYI